MRKVYQTRTFAKNKKKLLERYKTVVFMRDETLKGREYNVNYR